MCRSQVGKARPGFAWHYDRTTGHFVTAPSQSRLGNESVG